MDEFAELGQLDGFEGNSCEERAPFEHYSAPLRRLSGHNNAHRDEPEPQHDNPRKHQDNPRKHQKGPISGHRSLFRNLI